MIRVANLSKRYLIGQQASHGDGLRHVLQSAVSAPWAALKRAGRGKREEGISGSPSSISHLPSSRSSSEEFWALRDVSFEVKRGEVVGIIGRNGAGKSTLLKILSRITEPTSGRIEIDGRVASLLEVGTGFHPELTGRENIFLNGAILGMSRAEVRRKFDEIVDFSGVEEFLDTPVKRYSSGMYVRLAFAVAAHLEPEILIVDEVLAVGDEEFQRKCLGKMKNVSANGRTVIFVSHNLDAVAKLCTHGIILTKNTLSMYSNNVYEIIKRYRDTDIIYENSNVWLDKCGILYNNELFTPLSMHLTSYNPICGVDCMDQLEIKVEYVVSTASRGLNIGILLKGNRGDVEPLLYSSLIDVVGESGLHSNIGSGALVITIPAIQLNAGTYYIELVAGTHNVAWIIAPGSGPEIKFNVKNSAIRPKVATLNRFGLIAASVRWNSLL